VDETPQSEALLRELDELRQQVRALKLRDREATRTRFRLQQLFDSSPQAIVLLDNADRVVECNARFSELFGYLPAEAKGVPLNSLIVPADRIDEGATLSRRVLTGGTVETEVIRRHKDGSLIDVSVLGYPIRMGDEQLGIWGIYNDLRAIKRDRQTGLTQKSVFLDRLSTELKRSLGSGALVAVLILDIDRFKDVNDSFGLPVGDALLKAVVERLVGTLREIAEFGRLGPDEFGFLQTGITDIGSAIGLARRLLAALREPFEFDDLTLHVTASVGASASLWRIPAARELERQAQRALTLAKEAGGDTYHVFTPHLDQATRQRVILGQELYGSWQRQELVLEYQPQIDVDSTAIVGAEALVRWNHPVQGRLGPDRFIPIAEATGEIIPIGDWVLQAATAQAKSWERSLGRPVPIAVNLSAIQFKDPTLPQRVTHALEASALDADHLELEITESIFVDFNELLETTLHELERIGVGICLDDFGKGYSSLGYLRQLRLRRLKIDRSFVSGISPGGSDAKIVSAITALGSRLGIDVLAEGVETREQFDFVQAEGCQKVQGFYFSPALPPEEFGNLLASTDGFVAPAS
jgi:diguanylate cyclase (GGDEF)-like protein/PAS domain S-box-containing protein